MFKSQVIRTKTQNCFTMHGCVAQLARAIGSYPIGHWFESCRSHHIWPVGQEVKTTPFHGVIMGSIPVRVTIQQIRKSRIIVVSEFFFYTGNRACPLLGFCSGYFCIQLSYLHKAENGMRRPSPEPLFLVRSGTDEHRHSKPFPNYNVLTHPIPSPHLVPMKSNRGCEVSETVDTDEQRA